jgi:hypothetical protein
MLMPDQWTCPEGCSGFGAGLLSGLPGALAAGFAGALLVAGLARGLVAGCEAGVADRFIGCSAAFVELSRGAEASCRCAPPAAAESGRPPGADEVGAVCAP